VEKAEQHKHTHLTALCPGLPVSAGTRKVKQVWILLKQETVSGSGISWAVCKSAPGSRQITTSTPPFRGRTTKTIKTTDHFDEFLGILHGLFVFDVTRGKPCLDVVPQPLHHSVSTSKV